LEIKHFINPSDPTIGCQQFLLATKHFANLDDPTIDHQSSKISFGKLEHLEFF
jgi:hypothetical protein